MNSPPGFLDADFLLTTNVARELFHDVAEHTPIVDVHNHLPPQEIAEDKVWPTISDLWLGDDHYKWKAMRMAGYHEDVVTGSADPWDRFLAWAHTVERSIGNPLFVWTHLELRRVFGIDLPLNRSTAREIWDETNRQMPMWSAQRILAHFNVRVVATTDDPSDDLRFHDRHRERDRSAPPGGSEMIPTFRPDAAHRLLDDPEAWQKWAARLGAAEGIHIDNLESLLDALSHSYARFSSRGCRASDHGLSSLPDRPRDPQRADGAIRNAALGQAADDADRELVLLEVVALAAQLAYADDAVLQLHLGPLRNVSPRLLELVGRDAGADVMGDERQALGLARFLGDLEADGFLPRTVLYNLNPANNALFATMASAFSRPGVRSLVQWGPPWWFNDTEEGMRRQLDDLAQIGQLAGFIGMLTDSRSVLSMTRHELFRRVLCDTIGGHVEAGRVPLDTARLGEIVRDICINNAISHFGFSDRLGR